MKTMALFTGLLTMLGCIEEPVETVNGHDQCGAESLQHLIGTDAESLRAMDFPSRTRIIFPGMAVTKDFRLSRLNIHIDDQNRVYKVNCG